MRKEVKMSLRDAWMKEKEGGIIADKTCLPVDYLYC